MTSLQRFKQNNRPKNNNWNKSFKSYYKIISVSKRQNSCNKNIWITNGDFY